MIGGSGDPVLGGGEFRGRRHADQTRINTSSSYADNSSTLLGPIAINLGVLKVASGNALGATATGTTIVFPEPSLDLNGQTSRSRTGDHRGRGLRWKWHNHGLRHGQFLGALINSSATAASRGRQRDSFCGHQRRRQSGQRPQRQLR